MIPFPTLLALSAVTLLVGCSAGMQSQNNGSKQQPIGASSDLTLQSLSGGEEKLILKKYKPELISNFEFGYRLGDALPTGYQDVRVDLDDVSKTGALHLVIRDVGQKLIRSCEVAKIGRTDGRALIEALLQAKLEQRGEKATVLPLAAEARLTINFLDDSNKSHFFNSPAFGAQEKVIKDNGSKLSSMFAKLHEEALTKGCNGNGDKCGPPPSCPAPAQYCTVTLIKDFLGCPISCAYACE